MAIAEKTQTIDCMKNELRFHENPQDLKSYFFFSFLFFEENQLLYIL